MPDFDELHANIGLYKRLGVHGVFIQRMGQEGGGAESMALRGFSPENIARSAVCKSR